MPNSRARRGVSTSAGASIDKYLAGIIRVGAGENSHQCGLPSAVFADDGVDFSARKIEVHFAHSDGSGKAFEDPVHPHDRVRVRGGPWAGVLGRVDCSTDPRYSL